MTENGARCDCHNSAVGSSLYRTVRVTQSDKIRMITSPKPTKMGSFLFTIVIVYSIYLRNMENQVKIKVLYVITKSNWGGAQRYVYDLATALPKDIYDVEVILGGNGLLSKRLLEAGIPVISLPNLARDISLKDDWRSFVDLVKLFRAKRPDVIHLNSSKIGGLGALAGRLTRIPKIVYTAHGWAFNENRSFVSKIILKVIYWVTMLLSHQTIAVSEYMRRSTISWPFVYKKITVIYNGLRSEALMSKANARHELSKMHPGLTKALAESPASRTFWIGTIAELHHIKGYDIALRGIKQIISHSRAASAGKKIIYTIIGGGEEHDRLAALIEDLGLSKNVFLLGYVEGASQYLKAFDLFTLTSRSEGLAYVLIEAGMASVPVVATAVGGLPEIIDDMKTGVLIQPNKSEEVGYAIDFMATHDKVRKEYGVALHNKVLATFSLDETLSRTMALYRAYIAEATPVQ
jgi:glycosyltransferase involved in cell wall biosynthesis